MLREEPMAFPENKPPKSITLSALVRFCPVNLQLHIQTITFVKIDAARDIHLKGGIDAPKVKVKAIYLLVILREGLIIGALEVKRQTRIMPPAIQNRGDT
jgi:hypothetical protein